MCPVSARADGLGDLDWGLRRRGASAVERALGIPRFIAGFFNSGVAGPSDFKAHK